MKKIFTLLVLAFMAQVTFADDVIASFTFPDEGMTGPATNVAGTGCTVSHKNVGYESTGSQNAQLGGKYYHKICNKNGYITIKLSSGSFQAGDVFYATLYSGKPSVDGFCFKTATTANGVPAVGSNYKTITYSESAENTLDYTLTESDINDDGSITVYRYNTYCYVRHIEVTRAAGATKEDPTTSFTKEIFGFKASDGTATYQTVTTNSDGAVTYESSNTGVVTVDAATGALTAVAVGKAKITAKTASSSTYAASSASYTVYVLSDGDGTLENPYLPTDLRYLSETYEPQYEPGDKGDVETSVKAWVAGYILGVYNTGEQDIKIITGTTTTQGTIGLGNTASETVGNNCVAVQLILETEPRAKLNLKDNLSILGNKVWVYGRIGSFTTSSQQVAGLRHADYYSWNGVDVFPEPTAVDKISADEAKADGKIFTLSGMEVKAPAKGVYIQNGKKFVVK